MRECENVETVDENYSDLVWRACARPGVEKGLTEFRESGSICLVGAIGCCFVGEMDNLGEL